MPVTPTPVTQAMELPPDDTAAGEEPDTGPTAAPVKTGSEIIYPIKSFNDKTRICLTFDDGGNGKAVKKALEVLKKHEVKSTFFVVGRYLKTHEDLWKQAVEDGHLVCNHTQNHTWLTKLNSDDAKKEILEWETGAAEILGQEYVDKMKK